MDKRLVFAPVCCGGKEESIAKGRKGGMIFPTLSSLCVNVLGRGHTWSFLAQVL